MMRRLGFCGGGFWPVALVGRLRSKSFTIGVVVMMKITNSTNARSNSGVMFSSCIVPWCDVENFFMTSLFAGVARFCRQADFDDISLLEHVQNVHDMLVRDAAVPANNDAEVWIDRAQADQAGVEAGQIH